MVALGNQGKDIFKMLNEENNGQKLIDINNIYPMSDQPRLYFDMEKIESLAKNIKEVGVMNPIIVREVKDSRGIHYRIIAGERRYRAAKMAELKEVPVIIKDVDEKEMFLLALYENLLREDLTYFEELTSYKKLMEEYGMKQKEIASMLGKKESTISNDLAVLTLPEEILELIKEDRISKTQAKEIARAKYEETKLKIADRCLDDKLSAKQVRDLIARYDLEIMMNDSETIKPAAILSEDKSDEYNMLIEYSNKISELLHTKVKIKPFSDKKKGKIEISYDSEESLKDILEFLEK